MSIVKIIRKEKDPGSFYVESNYGLLMFDTGAATSQLPYSNLTRTLEKVQTADGYGAFGSKVQNYVIVDRLCVGDITAKNLRVSLDDSVGLLGIDVLKNYAFTLDTQNNEIILTKPFASDIRCKVGPQRGHIYVEVEILGKNCLAVIDTGASCSVLDESFLRNMNDSISAEKVAIAEDWTGETFETKIMSVDSLQIGNVRFPQHEFALLDFKQIFLFMEYPISAIIGASTFSCKKFSFNLIDGYLKIEE